MAWKRNETTDAPRDFPAREAPAPSPEPERRQASLGPSISIHGELSGEEDLIIEGRLEGAVSLREHSVTVGRSGRLKADIYGKRIVVEGEVKGTLYGSEEVVIRKDGKVEGSAVAPRVTLESGAKFRGQIDMQSKSVDKAFSPGEAGPPQSKAKASSGPEPAAASPAAREAAKRPPQVKRPPAASPG